MTDEERQKLYKELQRPEKRNETYYDALCLRAAEEIERLVAENAELRKTQLTFRTIERQPFTIKDEP